ncbi:mitochondrial thiamine pyrophosphate transporter [Xylographa parallela]|nr:mitochondrial thiamine pyrophosphate transporter [Xylographa parallela]
MIPICIPDPVTTFFAGALAGAVATSATYPLDLLRTRFAAQGTSKIYASLLSSVHSIHATEGLPGFFRGLGAGVAQIVPYMGLFFSTYETLRPLLAELDLPFGSGDASAGVLASVAAKSGVFPLDLIRKRIQLQGPARERFAGGLIPLYGKGVLRVGKEIIGKEGWRGLYRGLAVGLIKAAPASAVTMWTYERVLKELGDWSAHDKEN